jgi:hypothetical protein
MTEQERAIYDLYDELFASQGWIQFVTDLEDSKIDLGSVESIKDAKELHTLQGKLSMIDTILNMEHMMSLAIEQAEGDEDDYTV